MEYYNPFESMTFSYDLCFMCGCVLDEDNRSDEHIYPRWLQKEFDLWNQKLTLLNNTDIYYRDLIIPCCRKCNNEFLNAKVEKPIELAVKSGYEEFVKIDEKVIFQWLNKIAYGTLFKELSLRLNRSDINSPPIYNEKELQEHTMQFTFLQSIRFDTEFIGKPWSIMVFKVKNIKGYYNAHDMQLTKCFFIQMHDIGIISCLMDNGVQKEFFLEHFAEFANIELHPIQFAELCARFYTKSLLFIRSPFYIVNMPNTKDNEMQIISQPISGQLFKEWSHELFCNILEFFWQGWKIEYKEIYIDDEHHVTFLYNEDRTIKSINEQ